MMKAIILAAGLGSRLGEFGEKISPKNQFINLLKYSRQRGPDMIGY